MLIIKTSSIDINIVGIKIINIIINNTANNLINHMVRTELNRRHRHAAQHNEFVKV